MKQRAQNLSVCQPLHVLNLNHSTSVLLKKEAWRQEAWGMDASHVVVQMIYVRSPAAHVATAERAHHHRRKRIQNHGASLMNLAAKHHLWTLPAGEMEEGSLPRFP